MLRQEDHIAIRETPFPRIRGPTSPSSWLAIGRLTLLLLLTVYAALLVASVAATWGVAYAWGWQAGLAGFVVCLILSVWWGPGGPLGMVVYHILMPIGILVAGWWGVVLALPPACLIALMGWHHGGKA